MDEEIERLVVSVRADTNGFKQDIQAMRSELDGPFADGLEKAGRRLENALSSAIRRGKFDFEDLRSLALSVLNDIASAAIKSGLDSLFSAGGGSGGASGNGDFISSIGSVLSSAFGAPGRATGGPVSPGRAYMVGERGPELFVPTSSGSIDAGKGHSGQRPIILNVHVSDNGRASAPEILQRSSRQITRQLRRVLEQAGE